MFESFNGAMYPYIPKNGPIDIYGDNEKPKNNPEKSSNRAEKSRLRRVKGFMMVLGSAAVITFSSCGAVKKVGDWVGNLFRTEESRDPQGDENSETEEPILDAHYAPPLESDKVNLDELTAESETTAPESETSLSESEAPSSGPEVPTTEFGTILTETEPTIPELDESGEKEKSIIITTGGIDADGDGRRDLNDNGEEILFEAEFDEMDRERYEDSAYNFFYGSKMFGGSIGARPVPERYIDENGELKEGALQEWAENSLKEGRENLPSTILADLLMHGNVGINSFRHDEKPEGEFLEVENEWFHETSQDEYFAGIYQNIVASDLNKEFENGTVITGKLPEKYYSIQLSIDKSSGFPDLELTEVDTNEIKDPDLKKEARICFDYRKADGTLFFGDCSQEFKEKIAKKLNTTADKIIISNGNCGGFQPVIVVWDEEEPVIFPVIPEEVTPEVPPEEVTPEDPVIPVVPPVTPPSTPEGPAPKDPENLSQLDDQFHEDIAGDVGTGQIVVTPTPPVDSGGQTTSPSGGEPTKPVITPSDGTGGGSTAPEPVGGSGYSGDNGGANAGEYSPVEEDQGAQGAADDGERTEDDTPHASDAGSYSIDDLLNMP